MEEGGGEGELGELQPTAVINRMQCSTWRVPLLRTYTSTVVYNQYDREGEGGGPLTMTTTSTSTTTKSLLPSFRWLIVMTTAFSSTPSFLAPSCLFLSSIPQQQERQHRPTGVAASEGGGRRRELVRKEATSSLLCSALRSLPLASCTGTHRKPELTAGAAGVAGAECGALYCTQTFCYSRITPGWKSLKRR